VNKDFQDFQKQVNDYFGNKMYKMFCLKATTGFKMFSWHSYVR